MESHKGMSSSGKLYVFGLLLVRVLSSVDFAEAFDDVDFSTVAESGEDSAVCTIVSDELAKAAVFELSWAIDELENSADELTCCAEELICKTVVSITKLICFLFFCGKDSVNEFIGEKCFSDTSSANVVENAPKIAMINKILRYMFRGTRYGVATLSL